MSNAFRAIFGGSLTSEPDRFSRLGAPSPASETRPDVSPEQDNAAASKSAGAVLALTGTSSADHFTATAKPEDFDGGSGSDIVSYAGSTGAVEVSLVLGEGNGAFAEGDTYRSIENIEGSSWSDVLEGNSGRNALSGLAGSDTIHGNGGNDTIRGGVGSDYLTGEDGRDRINGGAGNDTIDAGTGQDIIYGGPGNDTIYGGPDPDVVCFNFKASDITFDYDGSDYSIWVEAPDGTDHIFSALTIATTTGTYRFDVPTETWVYDASMTTADWLGMKL